MTKKYNDLKSLVDQSNITAEDVKEGKLAYSNGEVITGTNKGTKRVLLGTSTSYDLKTNYEIYGLGPEDYKNITVDNFIVSYLNSAKSAASTVVTWRNDTIYVNEYATFYPGGKSYNETTGVATISLGSAGSGGRAWNDYGGWDFNGGSIGITPTTYLVY